MKLGQFKIYAISDGSFALDGGQMFGVVPKVLWEKKNPSDGRNRIRLGLTCLLVQTGQANVLIETGIGDKFDAKNADIYGVDHSTTLLDELKTHGLSPADIDVVINTHLHFDHCGWNTRRETLGLVPTFPRARYVIQRGEWEHACAPTDRDRASYVEEFFAAAEKQTEFLDGDTEILPGVRVEVLPGHTRYLQGVRVTSESQEAYFVSDLVPTSSHLPYPWIMSFDLYPMETLANKKRLLPELAAEKSLVVFPHDPAMPWARLEVRNSKIEIGSWKFGTGDSKLENRHKRAMPHAAC
jgi:glyoxylase-like metal-dependent hydrolase (beta-lactamase superfamily II)